MNPFAILGFNTTVLGRLSDEDIVSLVHSTYKALSKIHHPDTGGNPEAFQVIKQAYEELQDDDYRNEALREHRMLRRDRLDLAEAEVLQLEESLESLIESYVSSKLEKEFSSLSDQGVVLVKVSQPEVGAQYSYEDVDPDDKLSAEMDHDLLGCYKVLRINGSSVQMTSLLNDDSSYKIPAYAEALKETKWGISTGKSRSKYFIADRWYMKAHESCKLKDSRLEVRYQEDDKPKSDTKVDTKSVLYRFVEVEHKEHDLVLIGSIPEVVFTTTQQPTKGLKALPVGLISENTGGIKSGSSFERAKYYLRSLELNFKADHYLIGCRKVGKDTRYYIVGQILSFDAI